MCAARELHRREPLRKVNHSIRGSLSRIKISDMREAREHEEDPMERALAVSMPREPVELVQLSR